MKTLVIAVLIIFISGCGPTTIREEGKITYKDGGESYQLKARVDKYRKDNFFSTEIKHEVYLYINGVLAIRGPLHRDGSGHIQGAYKSKTVIMDCMKPSLFVGTQCEIHIDGINIGRVDLRYDFRQ
ncbi:MAG: hypothetical protein KJO08_09770 [Gammaproteobacteria bacterium]|nr:hypothetical protein [Gammaproteobacteria bacterium]NNJ84261.1 hypothetical protein [Gammaproteobacteria bacterium]